MNTPKFTGSRYVLAVQNLKQSVAFYRDKMGFKTWWKGEGWHFLERDCVMVMLGECVDDRSAFETNNHSYFAYIDTVEIDVLFEEFKKTDIEILQPLVNKPWGQREFAMRTIDGHRIMFGERIAGTPE